MSALDECVELAENISPLDAKRAKEEIAQMKKQLAEANKIILMTSAFVSRGEVQSRALDYVRRWEVE